MFDAFTVFMSKKDNIKYYWYFYFCSKSSVNLPPIILSFWLIEPIQHHIYNLVNTPCKIISLFKRTLAMHSCVSAFRKTYRGRTLRPLPFVLPSLPLVIFFSPNFKCIISKHTTTVTALGFFYIYKKFKGRLWAHLRCRSASVLAKLPPIFYVATLWVAVKAANTVRYVIYQPWLHPSLLFKVRAEDWALDSANIYLKINHSLLL